MHRVRDTPCPQAMHHGRIISPCIEWLITHCGVCISYMPQKLCDWVTNYNKNIALFVQMQMRMASSASSLQKISWILTWWKNLVHDTRIVCLCKSGNMQFTCQQKLMINFSTLFTAKHFHCKRGRFYALLKYFGLKIYWNEYQLDRNGNTSSDIETTKLELRYNHC